MGVGGRRGRHGVAGVVGVRVEVERGLVLKGGRVTTVVVAVVGVRVVPVMKGEEVVAVAAVETVRVEVKAGVPAMKGGRVAVMAAWGGGTGWQGG